MSMCTGCKTTADQGAKNRDAFPSAGTLAIPQHPCNYPHTCTCQHNRTQPTPTEVNQ